MSKRFQLALGFLIMFLFIPYSASAMHIMEGFLPSGWCVAWGCFAIPFLTMGFFSISKTIRKNPKSKILLSMAGAYTFILSALKIPSVTGSSSHPTGVGFGTILFGPTAMTVLGLIVLLFQAILLAHGGLTTLGANTFSMAVVGPLVAFFTYKLAKKFRAPQWLAVFLAASLSDLSTYITTSIQLALAFPAPSGGVLVSLAKFLGIFAFTQIPLAISEGIITVLIFNTLSQYKKEELRELDVFSREV